MKYISFYFIAASHQFILLQPSVQLEHFHARLAGGRDLKLSITVLPVVIVLLHKCHKRGMTYYISVFCTRYAI